MTKRDDPAVPADGAGPAEPVTHPVDEHGEVVPEPGTARADGPGAAEEATTATAGTDPDGTSTTDAPATGGTATRRTAPDGPAGGGGSAARSRRAPVLAGVAVVVAAALLGGAVFALVQASRSSATASEGGQRDTALDAARSIATTLTSVDGTDVAGTLTSWDQVVTGPLAEEFANSRAQLEQRASQSQASVTSAVANAALTQIDEQAGTASALIFVDATTRADPAASTGPSATPAAPSSAAAAPSSDPSATAAPSAAAPTSAAPDDQARSQRLALTMTLTKVDGAWKASNLEPVAQGTGQ